MPTFYGAKYQGEIKYDESQTELLTRFLATLKDGVLLHVRVEKETRPRTNKQLATIFGLLLARVKQFFDDSGWDTSYIFRIDNPTGVGVSVEQLKDYFYALYPMASDNGKRHTLSTASTEQAAKFFEDVRNHVASWGIQVPDPDPNWRQKK
jgi:hypothetical protein